MGAKSSQLQIRVSPKQKDALKRRAAEAGMSLSEYVLASALPSMDLEFNRLAGSLRGSVNLSKTLSDLALHLEQLPADDFYDAVSTPELDESSALLRNYVAATVEQEARGRGIEPPIWTSAVAPLDEPHFGWDLPGLRPHLMRVTPTAFKRRNVFVATAGDGRL